jgi:predicted permease
MMLIHFIKISILDIRLFIDYYSRIAALRRAVMSNQSNADPSTPVRSIPLIPIYAFSFLSALTVGLIYRFGQSARRRPLLVAGFLFAALVFGFVSSLALALALDFLRSLGVHVPVVPIFGVPVSMIILWTVGLVLAATWQRSITEREE